MEESIKYNINLKEMDILKYKIFLKKQYLIPSREILNENIDDKFKIFEKYGFKNVLDLKKAISTKTKINKLSDETKISSEYLNILRRELGTFDKKGILFKDFPIVNNDTIKKLDENGIKNTKYFYECYYKENNEKKISNKLKIPIESIMCLISLSTLVRINGIGALAATTFYEAGYQNIEDIINSTKEEMLEKITKINNEKKYYKAKLGLKDMQFIIDYANLIKYF